MLKNENVVSVITNFLISTDIQKSFSSFVADVKYGFLYDTLWKYTGWAASQQMELNPKDKDS